ncbi:hypothetical protein JIN77_04810 [Verrucomicrobiaceae bacterium R5-34]|uniref:Potassium channel protein n=1 Tax=Oceaniferula flava TaxID=2800421 RepID=A0AAE2SDR9_9BACT|nr:ion channel [Oceaniferula flavus]MBK1830031.1 hypothetical protein [Verrucomicrobiaceae bacterium R5-34]MBK1855122.1 hypothetical protein [Oceaniferula flavus]MBM1136428.1 hypothetical protein [Oceaniferula flavus]
MLFIILRRLLQLGKISLLGRICIALSGAFLLNLIFGIGFYYAERDIQTELTLTDSIWWAMVTMTTVGYGDYYPQSFIGRFFIAYPCFILGIGLIGYLLGSLAEALIDFTARKRKGLAPCKMKNHIIICHCPSETKVLQIVQEIRATPKHRDTPIVLLCNSIEEISHTMRKEGIEFVKGDPTDDLALERANIRLASGAFILAKDAHSAASDACTYAIGSIIEHIEEETGSSINTVAELVNERSLRMVSHSSIDSAVATEGICDRILVQEFLHPGLHGVFSQLLSNKVGSQLYIFDTKLKGKPIFELQKAALDSPEELQIIGIKRGDESMLNPAKSVVIEPDDQLFVLTEKRQHFVAFENSLIA